MALDLTNLLGDYVPPDPEFRTLPGPQPIMPSRPVFDPGVSALPAQPSRLDSFLSAFAQMPVQRMDPRRSAAERFIFAALQSALRGAGQRAAGRMKAGADDVEALNETAERRADFNNRQAMTLTSEQEKGRIDALKEQARAEREARKEARQKADRQSEFERTHRRIKTDQGEKWVPVREREPKEPRANGVRAGVKVGPIIPTLSTMVGNLRAAAKAFEAQGKVADAASRMGLAEKVANVHAQLREASSEDEVNAVAVPDGLPPDVQTALARAAQYRLRQVSE